MDAFKTVNKIFTTEPNEPNTYNLRLDPNDPMNRNVNINDILINILINGITTLFGNGVNAGNITREQFDLANSYMKSLGYNTKLELVCEDGGGIPTKVNISFEKI